MQKYVIEERPLRLAVSLVHFTHLKNLSTEKDKPMSRFTNQYKVRCEKNGSNVDVGVCWCWFKCWFLSPSFGGNECACTCMHSAILYLKVKQKQVVNNHIM